MYLDQRKLEIDCGGCKKEGLRMSLRAAALTSSTISTTGRPWRLVCVERKDNDGPTKDAAVVLIPGHLVLKITNAEREL